MKQIKHICLGLLALATPMILASCDSGNEVITEDWVDKPENEQKGDWGLVWSDEFNEPTPDNRPDPTKWSYDLGATGNGNNEMQIYTDRVENASYTTEDGEGCLKITALADNYQGVRYSSARIKSEGHFAATYGRFVARMKLPFGPGMWPAFWLLGTNFNSEGWPQCGEIDIMENKGIQPSIVSSSMHCPGHYGGSPFTNIFSYTNLRFDLDFHTFAAEWDENKITFLVDGQPYHTVLASQMQKEQWVFDHPFFIILNLAVGGDFFGGVGADPGDNTEFPQNLYIDYVRVYQRRSQLDSQDTNVSGGVSGWENGDDKNVDFH